MKSKNAFQLGADRVTALAEPLELRSPMSTHNASSIDDARTLGAREALGRSKRNPVWPDP
jgi:hypothetical protein